MPEPEAHTWDVVSVPHSGLSVGCVGSGGRAGTHLPETREGCSGSAQLGSAPRDLTAGPSGSPLTGVPLVCLISGGRALL